MSFRFREGDTFIDGDLEWVIVDIDHEDDEWPYECYPVKIVEKAKQMAKEEDDSFDEMLYWGDVICILNDYFIDERQCWSDLDIQEFMYETEIKKLKDEIKNLKAEIKKLKGGKQNE